jgi:acyl-CoA thioester hydrolase
MTLPLPPEMADGLHRYGVRVYYEDTDAGGIVYHANYLRFAERARTESLRAMGLPHNIMMLQYGMIFVVRRVEVDYQRPARLDEWLTVVTAAVEVGAASLILRQSILRDSETIAVLGLTLVSIRAETGRAERMPAPWRLALTAMKTAAGPSQGQAG